MRKVDRLLNEILKRNNVTMIKCDCGRWSIYENPYICEKCKKHLDSIFPLLFVKKI